MSIKRIVTPKINVTKNYRLFTLSDENRILNPSKHKRLRRSMMRYGFLPWFPIVCLRDNSGKLVVLEGQHRLAFAESLSLPVYWLEATESFDIAYINGTGERWKVRDYAERFALNGVKDYIEGLRFADLHGIPIGRAFALLSGVASLGTIDDAFKAGTFTIKDRGFADLVVSIYVPLTSLNKKIRNTRFLSACMAVCRVHEFSAQRLLQNAARCREKLVSYSTQDAFLDMLEEVYNYGRPKLVGLKAAATMAMRDRQITSKKKEK